MSETNQKDCISMRVPLSLVEIMDKYVGHRGFTSRAEVLKQAVREFENNNPHPTTQDNNKEKLDHINIDRTGVKIFDRQLIGNRLVHVSITPQGITCDYCETNNCEHTKYALTLPDVQKMITQKKKDGWNLPSVGL